jgi:hypothetical protein
VQAAPEDEAGVLKVNEAVKEVLQGAPAMAAMCDELDARVKTRLACAAAQDVAGMRAELAAVDRARATWQQLHQTAEESFNKGVALPEPASAAASVAEEASSRRPSAMSQRRASTLSRTVSSVSATSTSSSVRKKQSTVVKQPSRAPQAGGQ